MESATNAKLFCARHLLPIVGEPIEDGALVVEGGLIAAVGTRRDLLRAFAGAERIDFDDAVLLPPFANAHTHLELTAFPEWAARAGQTQRPESFVEWIFALMRVKRRVDPAEAADSIRKGIVESLRGGTGAVGDILSWHHGHPAYRGAPLRGRVFLEVLGRTEDLFRPRFLSALDLAAAWPEGALVPGLSPHSPYTLTPSLLREVCAAARDKALPASIHLAESAEEEQFLREGKGDFAEKLFPAAGWETSAAAPTSAVALLAACGALAPWNLLVHGVRVEAPDVEAIARSGATVVLCPRSNARLGVGKAPAGLYLRAGVPLALGTDSRASCDSLSLWDEIAFARTWFSSDLTPRDLLCMATLGGAQALGVESMGALRPGAGANFQLLTPSHLPAQADLYEFLCSPGRTADVAALYLDGRDVLQTL